METWTWSGDADSGFKTLWGDKRIVISLEDIYPGYAECGQDLRMIIDKKDAKLIAAAPMMFEILKGIIRILDLPALKEFIERIEKE